jgi:hypothetical protein|nr:hypothetical protein [Kofleriaceae bacterium]
MRGATITTAVCALAIAACSKASDSGEARNWSKEAPPHEVAIPDDLQIGVVIDGVTKPAITAQALAAKTPDFSDTERRAWRIAALEPEAALAGATVEASTPTGVAVRYPHLDGVEPVIYLTRRGEVAVATLDPKNPFPRYHGQGGRLRRPGDQLPHVMPVATVTITTPHGSTTP